MLNKFQCPFFISPNACISLFHSIALVANLYPPHLQPPPQQFPCFVQTCFNRACLTAITYPSGNTCVSRSSIRGLTPKQMQVHRSLVSSQLSNYPLLLESCPGYNCARVPPGCNWPLSRVLGGERKYALLGAGGGNSVLTRVETSAPWEFT